MAEGGWVLIWFIFSEQTASASQPDQSFSIWLRIIFLAQLVDVDPVSVLYVEHEIPGLAEHLLALTALQVNFFAVGCFLLKACNK